MSLKIIHLTVPDENPLPDIENFSPEENYLMLKIGSSCLLEGRKVVTNLTNDEIYRKIENDFKKEIEGLNNEIKTESMTSLKMREKITEMYESQIEQLNKRLENAMIQIKTYETDISTSLQEEVNKVKQKCDLMLEEKDRQNQLNREVFDKAVKLLDKSGNKSSISLGDSGEQIFENLADTFKDFTDFKIENKAKQSHKGDFHLFFKDFNILVDSKNYTSSVSKKEIQKIESDLNTNGNMNFAWLVSLNTNICDHNKFPITPKWITTDEGKVKCVLMINNLLDNKEPRNILRQAWQICDDFYKLTKKVKIEDGEVEKYREKNLIYKKYINNLQEKAYDLRRSMNTSLNVLKNMDNDLIEILSNVSDEIVNEKLNILEKVKEWWNNRIEYTDNNDDKIISTEIWNKFKKENKEYVGENNLSIEQFKDIMTSHMVKSSNYIEKTKKGAIELIGFKWKEQKHEEKEAEKIIENLELDNTIIDKTHKVKMKKEKKTEIYFDKETDKKILEDYENESNDIMTMCNDNIRPWQLVSLLMRYKIIKKREEARGYDKYKETEEYKSKIISK
jgi:hypothetical protein